MSQTFTAEPDHLAAVITAGFEEIIGRADLDELFQRAPKSDAPAADAAGSAPAWTLSFDRLEQLYGRHGAQGVAHRAGRASFHYWLREFGERLHLARLDDRLLPSSSRLRLGFDAIARTLQSQWGFAVELIEEELHWRWRLTKCPPSLLNSPAACCSYLAGFVQEYLGWISGGKFFPVSEIQCGLSGRPVCEVTLRKQPLD